MTSGLRKAHKYIWLIIAIIVPILIVFSVKDLNFSTNMDTDSIKIESTKYDIISSNENEFVKATLFQKKTDNELEIILKKPLKSASSLIYSLKSGKKATLIGQISSIGVYQFTVNEKVEGIELYDNLKNESITTIAL